MNENNIPMTYMEAVEHLNQHNKAHQLKERGAVLTTRALDIAIQLLKDSTWHNALTDKPSKSGDYLCCTEYGEILEAYYDESVEDEFPFGLWYGQYDSDTLGFIDSYWEAWDAIKWWRELPQLPKELEENNDERL